MDSAEVKLNYLSDGKRGQIANLEFRDKENDGVAIDVYVDTAAHPLWVVGMFGIALSAILEHYGEQGVFTPMHDIRTMLDMAVKQTHEALEFELAIEEARIIPITPEQVKTLFGIQPGDDANVFDGLHLCENCHDAYTTGRLCVNCAQQEAIDRDC